MRGLKYIVPAFAVFTLTPAAFESASAAPDPTGIWMNDTGRGAIEIKNCGKALCGNVVWVKSAADQSGCGKQILGDVAPVGGGTWDNGWIYSPEKGRKYDVEITPLSNGKLKVMGYAGMKFLSKTMIWTRAPQDLQLCGQTEAKLEQPATVKSDVTPVAAATPAPEAVEAPAAAAPEAAAPEAAAPAPVAAPAPAPVATAKASSEPAKAEAPAPQPEEISTATPDDDPGSAEEGAPDISKALGNLKLGNLKLEKVISRSNGKCHINTPWFKVTVNCEQ
jgi:uncharacterized protein (DUF2147 family)